MLVQPGFEPMTSRSADWRSPNWANQVAVAQHYYLKHYFNFNYLQDFNKTELSKNLNWKGLMFLSAIINLVPNVSLNVRVTLSSHAAWKKHRPAGINSCLWLERNSDKENVLLNIFLLSKASITELMVC